MNMANDWWHFRQEELLSVAGKGCPIYVYNEETLNETLFDLLSLNALDVLFYPVHANPHPKILKKVFEMDLGFTCISIDEITLILKNFPRLSPQRILFVPDHAQAEDFERAFDYGSRVAVNDLYTLKRWPGIFQNKDIFICMDLGYEQVSSELLKRSVRGFYVRPQVMFNPLGNLNETLSFLAGTSSRFPEVSTLIFGNSIDMRLNHEKCIMDIPGLEDHLETIKDACPQYRLWLELPDFMLSQAGVLLVKVTETGEDEGTRYIRINMDIKGLIFDKLHLACQQIINLSRLDNEETNIIARIIGRGKGSGNAKDLVKIPASVEKGDILLITIF